LKLPAFPFILISFLFCQTGQSQIIISILLGDKLNSGKIEFGIEGGYNRSYLSRIDNAKGLNNFHLGFYFDFKIKNDWYLNTGVRVKSNVGATNIATYTLGDEDLDSVMVDGHITRKISYFHVPVHIKYRFARQFYAQAGFQIGLRHNARDLFYNTVFEKDDVEFTHDIREQIKRLDAGLSGGLGYKFQGTGMNLGITYYYGLVNIMKNSESESFNSTFYIYVNIPVGAGYRDEKPQK
ncbi:MAG: PorT family protein, partial [Bacteroidales bacterium]|nr:PorT family protein [Bacteroidales bacterium]